MNTFQPIFYKITNLTTSWNFKSLAKDGKVVLINSYLMSSLPTGLSVYPFPDTTFDSISKLAKKFLQSKDDNKKGIHFFSQNNTTHARSERGLGI